MRPIQDVQLSIRIEHPPCPYAPRERCFTTWTVMFLREGYPGIWPRCVQKAGLDDWSTYAGWGWGRFFLGRYYM